MSKFEILCVTMHQNDFSKIKEMNVHSNIVYANQCDRTSYEETEFEGHKAKMISTQTRGVGINRNLALLHASAEICLLADDDLRYCDDMEKKVLSEFENHPDADVIFFNFTSNDPVRTSVHHSKTKKVARFGRSPWGAVRIAFRLDSVRRANVWFSTLFGGGCIFPQGEDTMWIKSLKKPGLTFYVSREIIGEVFYDSSTWFTGYNESYYYGIGAIYAACNRRSLPLRFLYTLLRTRKNKELTARQKLTWLRHGKKGYKKMMSYNDYKKTVK